MSKSHDVVEVSLISSFFNQPYLYIKPISIGPVHMFEKRKCIKNKLKYPGNNIRWSTFYNNMQKLTITTKNTLYTRSTNTPTVSVAHLPLSEFLSWYHSCIDSWSDSKHRQKQWNQLGYHWPYKPCSSSHAPIRHR